MAAAFRGDLPTLGGGRRCMRVHRSVFSSRIDATKKGKVGKSMRRSSLKSVQARAIFFFIFTTLRNFRVFTVSTSAICITKCICATYAIALKINTEKKFRLTITSARKAENKMVPDRKSNSYWLCPAAIKLC